LAFGEMSRPTPACSAQANLVVREADAAGGAAGADVGQAEHLVTGEADAGADEGREAVPVAEIDIAVHETDDRSELGFDEVDAAIDLAREDVAFHGLELGRRAVLGGEIGAEPVVELVAGAEPDEGLIGDQLVIEAVTAGRADKGRVRVHAFDLIEIEGADADVAAKIPGAPDLDRRRAVRHGRRRREEIGRKRGSGRSDRENARQSQ
jgi:hypothetical protein